ncbi:hypothetical protein K502DRAFT_324749 [Neoconidiobolus thromboides FSU 785]|nr:hypothetical protein K502DRAFT_324749 [Neoconidiobolus thromboides FSU 785]
MSSIENSVSAYLANNKPLQQLIASSGLNNVSKLFNVIATTLTYTDGRDKSMKVIQYTLSVLMITLLRKKQMLLEHHERIDGVMKMFGDARKIVRLMNFTSFFAKLVYLLQGKGFNPNTAMGAVEKENYGLIMVKTTSEMINAITDDLFCLSKYKIVDSKFGTYVKTWSIKLWWTSLSIDLYLHVMKYFKIKKEIEIQEKGDKRDSLINNELHTIKVNFVKILSDMIFCGYDLFHINKNIEIMHFAGIVSGYIGYSRLFKKVYNSTKA